MGKKDVANSALGLRVRHVRKSLGLTLDALAELCGYSGSYLSRLETGDLQWKPAHIVVVSAALGLTAGELIGDALDARPNPDDDWRAKLDEAVNARRWREAMIALAELAHEDRLKRAGG